jgi:hypothetical protein
MIQDDEPHYGAKLCMYNYMARALVALLTPWLQQLGDSLGKGAFGQVYRG